VLGALQLQETVRGFGQKCSPMYVMSLCARRLALQGLVELRVWGLAVMMPVFSLDLEHWWWVDSELVTLLPR